VYCSRCGNGQFDEREANREGHVHYMDVIVHPDEFVKDLSTCPVNYRDSCNTHTPSLMSRTRVSDRVEKNEDVHRPNRSFRSPWLRHPSACCCWSRVASRKRIRGEREGLLGMSRKKHEARAHTPPSPRASSNTCRHAFSPLSRKKEYCKILVKWV